MEVGSMCPNCARSWQIPSWTKGRVLSQCTRSTCAYYHLSDEAMDSALQGERGGANAQEIGDEARPRSEAAAEAATQASRSRDVASSSSRSGIVKEESARQRMTSLLCHVVVLMADGEATSMPEAMARAMLPLSTRGYGSPEMLMVEALDDTIRVDEWEITDAVMRAVATTRIGIVIQHTTQPASTVMHLQEELHAAGMLASHQAEWLKEYLRQCRGRGLDTPQEEWLDIWFHPSSLRVQVNLEQTGGDGADGDDATDAAVHQDDR